MTEKTDGEKKREMKKKWWKAKSEEVSPSQREHAKEGRRVRKAEEERGEERRWGTEGAVGRRLGHFPSDLGPT